MQKELLIPRKTEYGLAVVAWIFPLTSQCTIRILNILAECPYVVVLEKSGVPCWNYLRTYFMVKPRIKLIPVTNLYHFFITHLLCYCFNSCIVGISGKCIGHLNITQGKTIRYLLKLLSERMDICSPQIFYWWHLYLSAQILSSHLVSWISVFVNGKRGFFIMAIVPVNKIMLGP